MAALSAWHKLLYSARNPAVFEYGIPTPFDRAPAPFESITPEQQAFLDSNKTLQDFCDKLLREDPRNALALYFKGVSFENLSTQALTIERKYTLAIRHAKAAGKLHRDALALEPALVDAKTSTAVPEFVVGTYNITVRWIGLFLGLRGNKKAAVEKLTEVMDKGVYRATDARLVLGMLQAWKGDPKQAAALFAGLRAEHPRSFLGDLALATAYEESAKDLKSAIGVYEELLRDMARKAPGIHPAEIHLRIGKDYALLGDYDLAMEHLDKALQSVRGHPETTPLVYYQMALIHEKRGDKAAARNCYKQVAAYSGPSGLIEEEMNRASKKIR
jgi:tetratricopeptide (TPR) repeat protein